MLLRDVQTTDVDLYLRLRCDPAMMADLGGPLPSAGMAARVRRDARMAAEDLAWIKAVVPDPADPATVAGTVTLWTHREDGPPASEIGWMVLPRFQGRGLATRAAAALLDRARADGRWGVVQAYPAVTNLASNAICRSLGFTLRGEQDVAFAGRLLRCHRWTIDTGAPAR